MNAELQRYHKAFMALATGLGTGTNADALLALTEQNIQTEPLSGMDFEKLLTFIREYTQLRQVVASGNRRFQELGLL